MGSRFTFVAALLALGLCPAMAAGGGLDIHISDARGNPVANAVVSLRSSAPMASFPAGVSKAVIDQDFETFLPLVTVLRTGGAITFHNSDRTMHQVYSFAPIKQFELEVDVGETSRAIAFDKPGVVAIGCNIHDGMIAYVYVTDDPLTALSDQQGEVHFNELPPGVYQAILWQPDLASGSAPPTQTVTVGEAVARVAFTVKLLPPRRTHSGHMGSY